MEKFCVKCKEKRKGKFCNECGGQLDLLNNKFVELDPKEGGKCDIAKTLQIS